MAHHSVNFPDSCNKLGMNENNFVHKLKELGPEKITNQLIRDLYIWAKTKSSKRAGHWSQLQDCVMYIYGLQLKNKVPNLLKAVSDKLLQLKALDSYHKTSNHVQDFLNSVFNPPGARTSSSTSSSPPPSAISSPLAPSFSVSSPPLPSAFMSPAPPSCHSAVTMTPSQCAIISTPPPSISAISSPPPTPISAISPPPPTSISAISSPPPTPVSAISSPPSTPKSAISSPPPTPISAISSPSLTPISAISSPPPTPISAVSSPPPPSTRAIYVSSHLPSSTAVSSSPQTPSAISVSHAPRRIFSAITSSTKCAVSSPSVYSKSSSSLCTFSSNLNSFQPMITSCVLHKKRISELEAENLLLRDENTRLKNELRRYKEIVSKCGGANRIRQNLKRKAIQSLTWKNKCKKLEKQTSTKKVQSVLKKCNKLRHVSKSRSNELGYQKRKGHGLAAKTRTNTEDTNTAIIKRMCNLRKEETSKLKTMENELEMAKETINELTQETIPTKKNKKEFTTNIRLGVMLLKGHGVSNTAASPALKDTVEAVANKELEGHIPSTSYVTALAPDMKQISMQQIIEAVDKAESITLKYDGTTKNGRILTEVELEMESGIYLCGVREQVDGSAIDTANTIMEILNDICAIKSDRTWMEKIKNSMSDRCIVNQAVETILEERIGHKLNSFKCAVHPLDTMARDSEKAIQEIETGCAIEKPKDLFINRKESITQGIIRGIGKLWYNDKFGLIQELTAHFNALSDIEATSKKFFHRFVGNRFHIYFLDAGLLYAYKDSYVDFLQNVHGGRDGLHGALTQALQDGSTCNILVMLRSLGIIGKRCTAPWLAYSEDPSLNILDINTMYHSARDTLATWSKDATPMLTGTGTLFPNKTVNNDFVMTKLLEPMTPENNTNTITTLQHLCCTLADVVNRQCKDQLPGGKYWNPSEELKRDARVASPNNISGERAFATADSYINKSPNATMATVETHTMIKCNKSMTWLKDKDTHTQKNLLENARKSGKEMKQKEKERARAIKSKILEKIKKKRFDVEKTEEKRKDKKEKLIQQVYDSGGLWTTKQQMQHNMTQTKTKGARLQHLKSQIQIRNILLCNKSTIKLSSPEEELKEHVQGLILKGMETTRESAILVNILQDVSYLKNVEFTQKWKEDTGRIVQYKGTVMDIITVADKKKDYEELHINYDDDETDYFLNASEFVADILDKEVTLLLE